MPTETVVLFRNGLGNFICYTPALQALASLDSHGKVDVCLDKEWKDNRRDAMVDLVKGMPFVNALVEYPDISLGYKKWFWSRHTYPCEALRVFMERDHRLDVGIAWQHSGIHEIESYMQLVRRFFSFTGETPKQYAPVDESFDVQKKKMLVALCNGSYKGTGSDLSPSKVWGGFKELAKILKGYYDCEIAKIGYLDELNDVEADRDYVGKLNILQTAKVIKECDLLVTTDTCNMHIGDALNTKMVVIWGGSILTKNQPVNGTAAIVSRGLGCQPCHDPDRFQYCVGYPCLASLRVGDVMREVRKMFP